MLSVRPFCLLIFMLTSIAMKNTTDVYENAMKPYTSRSPESENLKIILDYIRSKREFYPLTMSLVSFDIRSDFVDLVSKYVTSQSIISYKITMNNFSRRHTWQNCIDLTWIFVVEDVNILRSLVYEQSHIWKTANQYLIIIVGQRITMALREIFQIIWKNYNVYKLLAVSIQDDFRCLNKYLPFEKDRQSEYGVVHKSCLITRENNISHLKTITMKRIAKDHRAELYDSFKNLNEYPIRVVVFQSLMMNIIFEKNTTKNVNFRGVDADIMSLLEKKMRVKFRVNVISNINGGEDPFHRALRYIETGASEMIVTNFLTQRYKKYERYAFTAGIFEDKLCLIAPTTGFMPKSYMPILPFTPNLWGVLAIYNILISILWFLVKYCSGSFRRHQPVLLPLTTNSVPSSTVSNSPPRIHPYVSACFDLIETSCYPLKEDSDSDSDSSGGTTAQRALLFGTLFFGLIVTGLYQSCLVSNLSEPLHYPELDTLEDIANSNLTIITKYCNLEENTFTENTTLANKLKGKMEVFSSDKPTNDLVAFTKKVALGRYTSFKLNNLSKYYDEDGNELLHIVEECSGTYSLSYVVRLYSPYLERINELLLRMQEAGFVELWYKNMTYPMYTAEQRRKMTKSERRIKLTIEHYSLTFLGLLLGLLTCAFVFFAELYFAKGMSRKR